MKRITFLTLLILSVFGFNSCKDQIAGTEFINYASIDTNVPTVMVIKGTSTDVDINVYATQTSGAEKTFDVEVIADNTTANTESYDVPATLTIPANSNKGTITVTAIDDNLGEAPVTLELKISSSDKDIIIGTDVISLTIQKVCPLDIDDFVGTYSGDTEGDWGPTQIVTSLDGAGHLQITGIGVAFLTDYWGEVIVTMATLPVIVDMETGNFSIDEAPYITTTYLGAPQAPYGLKATGNLNACSGVLTIRYDLLQPGAGIPSYVEEFESQTAFTEIVTLAAK